MKQGKQVKRMTSYTIAAPNWINPTNDIGYFLKWARGLVVTTSIAKSEKDKLSFMEKFDAPKLSEVRVSLNKSGNYTQDQVEEIIAGLSTLPEYN